MKRVFFKIKLLIIPLFYVTMVFIFFSCQSNQKKIEIGNFISGKIDTSKYYYIMSLCGGKFLDIEGASKKNGAKLLLYSFNGKANQKFKFKLISDSTYCIFVKCSGNCLDIMPDTIAGFEHIIQNTFSNNISQFFYITPQHYKTYRIFSLKTKKSFDVLGARKDNGTIIILYPNSIGDNQKFNLMIAN